MLRNYEENGYGFVNHLALIVCLISYMGAKLTMSIYAQMWTNARVSIVSTAHKTCWNDCATFSG